MDLTPLFTPSPTGATLNGSTCTRCGTVSFPPGRLCTACKCREVVPFTLSGRGRLRVAVSVSTPPWGFDEPVTVGVVELDEGPAVFALITEEADAGTPVQAWPHPVRSEAPGFAFRTAR